MSVRRGLVSACVLALSLCLLAAPAPASGLDDRVLFGESVDGVITGRNTQIDGGVVGANGRIVVRRGAVVPDLEGASDVRIRRGVQAGAIRAGGTVTVHRTASVGPVTAHASVPNQALPVLEASPDPSRDVIRKAKDVKAGPLVLAPGRYGAVRAVKGDRVVLRSGTYDLEELTLREDTTLVVQLAGGPLVVRVSGDIVLARGVTMQITGGGAADVLFVAGGTSLWLRRDGSYAGTWLAPNGRVIVGRGAQLVGAAWGDRVLVRQGATVQWAPFSHPGVLYGCSDNGDCDDDNSCTEDVCDGSAGCAHLPVVMACDDGDVCTDEDSCEDGACVGGAPRDCDDENPCTDDVCTSGGGCTHTARADQALCDDGSACTGVLCAEAGTGLLVRYAVADAAGAGGHGLWLPGFFSGNEQHEVRMSFVGGARLEVFEDGAATLEGQLEVTSLGGGPGTLGRRWDLRMDLRKRGRGPAGQGTGGPKREQPAWQPTSVTNLWDYYDIAPGTATLDEVDGDRVAELEQAPAGSVYPLQLGSAANGKNQALGASAWFTWVLQLEDEETREGHGDVNVDLAQEAVCPGADQCVGGSCQGGSAVHCDDGDACTTDACDPELGCSISLVECDDGNACNGEESCDGAVGCVAGVPLPCDDGNPCTDDSCHPVLGCLNEEHARACDDGDPCTTGEACGAGICGGGAPALCDDSDPCTDDACDPQVGCVHPPNHAPCDDDNACTAGDQCADGACGGGGPVVCDDGNPCTADVCDPAVGCVAPAGNAGAICRAAAGVCDAAESCDGVASDCPADVKATSECRAAAGVCDAAEICDGVSDDCPADVKATSECRAAAGVCDAAEICDGVSDDCPADAPAPNGTPCDDANACTQTDRCQLGACVGVDPIVCAPDDCHEAGLCDPLSGACSSSPAPDGLLCDDGDPTTFDDACQSGTCEGLSPPCDASLYEPELTFLHGGPAGQSWLVSVCKLPDAVDPAAAATRSYSSACSAEAGVMDVTTWSNPDKSLFVNGLAAAALDQIGPSALTSQHGYPDQSPYFAGQPWTVVALLGTDKTAVTHQSANSCSCNAYDFTVTGQDSVDHRMVAMNFWQHPYCSTTGYNPILGPVWDQSYRAAVWPGYAANDVGVTPIYAYYNGDCSLCLGAPAPIFKASDVPYGAASACGRGPNESYATRVACALPVPPIDVAAGESHACAVMADGRVYCWGANHHGQLGDGTFTTRTRPVQVLGIDNAVSVALGSWHSCALLKTGEVRCWGYNTHGNLGRGTSSSAEVVPAAVVGITDAVALSSRYNHACVVRAGGAVACWGYNYSGAVGGSASPAFPHGVLSPRPVSGVASAVAVATGAQMSCAVLQGGGVTCWGDNAQGQLGDGTTVPHVTPAPVLGLSDALALTAGLNHVCAIRANHALVCWGANASGQLGNGTTVDGHLPTPVPGLTRVRRIDAGWHHTCASDAYGRAWCWGDNTQGELGTGGYGLSPLPVAVASSGTVRALAAGSDTGDIGSPQRFSCAVVDDQLECWGRNAWGQLGDGTFVDHPAPAAVLAP